MSTNTFTRLVQFFQPSGVEVNINLVLEEKPARQNQKLKTLTKYMQQYPSGWKKRLELADLLYEIGSWEQAVEEYHQVIERQPHRIDLRLKLAKILQLMGKQNDAIAIYESALSLAKNLAIRQHINGLIAVCKDDTQGAIQAFESAISLEPDNAVHWLALGQIQMETENVKAALEAFDTILSLNPEDLIALIYSYDALIAVDNFAQAQERLNRARELAPDDYQVLKRLAQCRCRLRLVSGDEGKQTKQMISSVLGLSPDAADVHELLAYYHILRGEREKGIGVLLSFTQQHPNNPRGWYYYARCLFHTGDTQAAAEAIFKAYNLEPNNREIARALEEF